MTYISPLLQSKIGAVSPQGTGSNQTGVFDKTKRNYDEVYEELKSRANNVKPNEAKAQLVVENPIQAAVSYVKDTKQDISNLSQAIVTGKLSDFPLGRLNDLGLKFGSLLIATFLAMGSKTKTEAIMKFIGGGTFLASMSLWPKFFINLPARLVHGFRIDEKYVSAQGDKKDLFLDNQFIPWDCYPKDKLMQNAKRAGIDPNEENSEEKIKRKMQKTALQNRALWMFTAGFATPTMTSLICNRIEPYVENAVVQHDVKKSLKILSSPENLQNYLAASKPEVQNREAINILFREYQTGVLDEDFFKRLSQYLNLNIQGASKDDIKALSGSFSHDLIPALKEVVQEQPVLTDEENLKGFAARLKEIITVQPSDIDSMFSNGEIFSADASSDVVKNASIDTKTMNEILEKIKAEKTPGLDRIKEILKEYGIVSDNEVKELTSTLRFDNSKFFSAIKDYNENVLSVIRGRLKAYNTLINNIAGSRAESAFTKMSTDTIGSLFKRLNLSQDELKTLATSTSEMYNPETAKYGFDKAREVLIDRFVKFAQENKDATDEVYAQNLQKFIGGQYKFELGDAVSTLADKETISTVVDVQMGEHKDIYTRLTNAIFGDKNEIASVYDRIREFIKGEAINLDALQNKPLLCANIERRFLDGSFEAALKEQGLITDNTPLEHFKRVARKMIYDNSVSLDACKGEMDLTESTFGKLKEIVYDPSQYEKEFGVKVNDVLKNFRNGEESSLKDLITRLKNLGTTSNDYSRASSFFQMAKNTATKMSNSKAWMKGCGIFAAVLVGVTLLAQPFFGNIKDEFPENSKKQPDEKKEGGKQ